MQVGDFVQKVSCNHTNGLKGIVIELFPITGNATVHWYRARPRPYKSVVKITNLKLVNG